MSSWHQNVTPDQDGHQWEGCSRGGHRPAVCRAGGGVAAEAHSAESHLEEAHRGQQDLGALRSAAQRRVPPNHSFGLTCRGWPPSPSPCEGSLPLLPLWALGTGQGRQRRWDAPPTEQPWDPGDEPQAGRWTHARKDREESSHPQVQGKNRNGTERKGKMKVTTGNVRGANTPSQTLSRRVAVERSGHPPRHSPPGTRWGRSGFTVTRPRGSQIEKQNQKKSRNSTRHSEMGISASL